MPNPSTSPPTEPAATAFTRRRRRQLLLSSSSPSSSRAVPTAAFSSPPSALSSASSDLPSFSLAPSPLHNHFFLSPLRASAVPFSWEHRPGIPKTPVRQQAARAGGKAKKALPLPLPPFLLSTKVGAADEYFIVPDDAKARWQRQRWQRSSSLAATLTDWLAVLSLYMSCTRSVTASPTRPRPHAPAKA